MRKRGAKVFSPRSEGSPRSDSDDQSDDEFALLAEAESDHKDGLLQLAVLEAKSLRPYDRNGLSDPYYIIRYGKQVLLISRSLYSLTRKEIRGLTKWKTLTPVWVSEHCLEPVDDVDLEIQLWDKDRLSSAYVLRYTIP